MSTQRNQRSESLVEAASLSALDLFRELPASCLQRLEQNSEVRDFRKGHIFFRAGESGQVFFLEQGNVQTYRTSGKHKLVIAELMPPAGFGEMGCGGQCMYHCAAQATEASRIRSISRTDLDALLDEHPIMTRRLLDLVSQHFVPVLLDLEATSFRNLIPRLAELLLENAEAQYVRNMTHKEMAEHLRVYRESATTVLG